MNTFPKSLLALFAGIALAGTTSAQIIGIDFDLGGASGQSPAPADLAGPVATTGWNNNVDLNNPPTAYVPYNPYNPSDIGSPLTLVDNAGATTTGTFGFNNFGFSTLNGGSTYSPGYGATGAANGGYTPDQQLYNGAASAAYNGYVQQITLGNIPYAQFNVYILATAIANAPGTFGEGSIQLFSGSASVTAGPTYYFGSTAQYGSIPSSPVQYVQATSTDQQNPTMGADYVLFIGLTGGNGTIYSFDLSGPDNASSSFNSFGGYISAVEIVAVPEPSTIGLLGLAALSLCAFGRRRLCVLRKS